MSETTKTSLSFSHRNGIALRVCVAPAYLMSAVALLAVPAVV
eukprot:SAG31_NODE_35581_length_321_cov_2.067568_1_plen_41_part_10